MPVRTWVCLRVSYWSRMTQPASRFFVVSQVLTGRYQPVADPHPPVTMEASCSGNRTPS